MNGNTCNTAENFAQRKIIVVDKDGVTERVLNYCTKQQIKIESEPMTFQCRDYSFYLPDDLRSKLTPSRLVE